MEATMILPVVLEFGRLRRVISNMEVRKNPRLKKKLWKMRTVIDALEKICHLGKKRKWGGPYGKKPKA